MKQKSMVIKRTLNITYNIDIKATSLENRNRNA